MNKAAVILTTSALALASAFAGEAPVPPTATVTEIAEKTVTVKDKGPVTLDAAYTFEATEESETYAGWVADFVVTFDRDVAAGEVELYGQADYYGDDWIAWKLDGAKANEPKRLIEWDALTYSTLLSQMPVFNCGAKSDISGLKMTVELRLYNPDDEDDWVTIARVKHTFGKWFDARVEQYEDWPDDKEKAYGGEWGYPENAKVMTPGELFINGDNCFNATEGKTLGTDISKATIEGVAEFSSIEGANFPNDALSTSKGGVLIATDGDELSYYAIARDYETNAWVKLEGPEVKEGMTPFKITLVKKWTGLEFVTYVTYNMGGEDYEYYGQKEIEVVDTDYVLSGVGFGGSGTLSSLSATVERIRRGMMYFVK